MSIDDYDEVLALWRSCAGLGEAESRDEIAAFLERNPQFSPVARSAGRLVGAVLCGHDGRRGYLYHLAVAAESRKQGVANQLVEYCLARLTAIGIRRCSIHLYVDNPEGEKFWLRTGWRERVDLKVMARDLA